MVEPRLSRWKSWYRFWVWVVGAVVFGLLVLAVLGVLTVLVPLLVACLLGIVAGAVELLGPRTFLEWREADAHSSTTARQALEVFDAALGTSRDDTGEFGPAAIRRVRIVGGIVFTGSILLAGGLVAAGRAGAIP